MNTKKEIKEELKKIKQEQAALKQKLRSLPKETSKSNNSHLPRKNGRFVSSLKGEKVSKQLLLRPETVEAMMAKAAQEGISVSEYIDIQLSNNAVPQKKSKPKSKHKPREYAIIYLSKTVPEVLDPKLKYAISMQLYKEWEQLNLQYFMPISLLEVVTIQNLPKDIEVMYKQWILKEKNHFERSSAILEEMKKYLNENIARLRKLGVSDEVYEKYGILSLVNYHRKWN